MTEDRITGTDWILREVKQYKRLEPLGLDDAEIAHRMAATETEVHQIRKLLGGSHIRLRELSIRYHARFLLGEHSISTLGDLFSWSDKELLSIHGIGPKTLEHIKSVVCDYMEKDYG